MPKSNILGVVLRYVAEARAYAICEVRDSLSGIMTDASRDPSWQLAEMLDVNQELRLAMTSVWVYSSIDLVSNRAAGVPFTVQTVDDGKWKVPDPIHPFQALLESPNSQASQSLMRRQILYWHRLLGNAYVAITTEGPGYGEPQELIVLPATAVKPIPVPRESTLTGQPINDYELTINGQKCRWPGENMVHFRTPNPFDFWQGLSPLVAARLTLQQDYAQQKWMADWFGKENAIPTAIISLPPEISPADFEQAKNSIRREFGENKRSAIIRGGDMSVQTITQTLEQMEMLKSREFNRDSIDRIYGTSGMFEPVSSGEAQNAREIGFTRNVIQPLVDYIAEQWTLSVGPYYGDDWRVHAENVIPQDRALAVAEYNSYSQDRTIDENRAVLGLDPWEPTPEQTLLLDFGAEPSKVPVRLIGQVDAQSDPGSLPGQQSPEQATDDMAGKAIALGVETELQRWRKVALRAFRNDEQRDFDTEIIPLGIQEGIRSMLLRASTEEEVKAAFVPPFCQSS